jgi:hypothetical protein
MRKAVFRTLFLQEDQVFYTIVRNGLPPPPPQVAEIDSKPYPPHRKAKYEEGKMMRKRGVIFRTLFLNAVFRIRFCLNAHPDPEFR